MSTLVDSSIYPRSGSKGIVRTPGGYPVIFYHSTNSLSNVIGYIGNDIDNPTQWTKLWGQFQEYVLSDSYYEQGGVEYLGYYYYLAVEASGKNNNLVIRAIDLRSFKNGLISTVISGVDINASFVRPFLRRDQQGYWHIGYFKDESNMGSSYNTLYHLKTTTASIGGSWGSETQVYGSSAQDGVTASYLPDFISWGTQNAFVFSTTNNLAMRIARLNGSSWDISLAPYGVAQNYYCLNNFLGTSDSNSITMRFLTTYQIDIYKHSDASSFTDYWGTSSLHQFAYGGGTVRIAYIFGGRYLFLLYDTGTFESESMIIDVISMSIVRAVRSEESVLPGSVWHKDIRLVSMSHYWNSGADKYGNIIQSNNDYADDIFIAVPTSSSDGADLNVAKFNLNPRIDVTLELPSNAGSTNQTPTLEFTGIKDWSANNIHYQVDIFKNGAFILDSYPTSNLTSNYSYLWGTNSKVAQAFIGTNNFLKSIEFYCEKAGAIFASIWVELWVSTGTEPLNMIAKSQVKSAADFSAIGSLVDFAFSETIFLHRSKKYHAVLVTQEHSTYNGDINTIRVYHGTGNGEVGQTWTGAIWTSIGGARSFIYYINGYEKFYRFNSQAHSYLFSNLDTPANLPPFISNETIALELEDSIIKEEIPLKLDNVSTGKEMFSGSSITEVAQQFIGNGETITELGFWVKSSLGTSHGVGTIKLTSNTGGSFGNTASSPNTIIDSVSTPNLSSLINNTDWTFIKVALTTPYATTDNVAYWATFEYQGGNASNKILVATAPHSTKEHPGIFKTKISASWSLDTATLNFAVLYESGLEDATWNWNVSGLAKPSTFYRLPVTTERTFTSSAYSPDVSVNVSLLVATFTIYDETVTTVSSVDVTISLLSVSFSIFSASVTSEINVSTSINLMTLTLTPLNQTVTTTSNVSTSIALSALSFSVFTATVTAQQNIDVSISLIPVTFTLFGATVENDVSVDVSVSVISVTFTIHDETVTTTTNVDATVNVTPLTFTDYNVSITGVANASISLSSATITIHDVTVDSSVNVSTSVNVIPITFTIYEETVTTEINVDVTVGLTSYSVNIQSVTVTTEVSVDVAINLMSATFTIYEETVSTTSNVDVSINLMQIAFTVYTADVDTSTFVNINIALLNLDFTINTATVEADSVFNAQVISVSISALSPSITGDVNINIGLTEITFALLTTTAEADSNFNSELLTTSLVVFSVTATGEVNVTIPLLTANFNVYSVSTGGAASADVLTLVVNLAVNNATVQIIQDANANTELSTISASTFLTTVFAVVSVDVSVGVISAINEVKVATVSSDANINISLLQVTTSSFPVTVSTSTNEDAIVSVSNITFTIYDATVTTVINTDVNIALISKVFTIHTVGVQVAGNIDVTVFTINIAYGILSNSVTGDSSVQLNVINIDFTLHNVLVSVDVDSIINVISINSTLQNVSVNADSSVNVDSTDLNFTIFSAGVGTTDAIDVNVNTLDISFAINSAQVVLDTNASPGLLEVNFNVFAPTVTTSQSVDVITQTTSINYNAYGVFIGIDTFALATSIQLTEEVLDVTIDTDFNFEVDLLSIGVIALNPTVVVDFAIELDTILLNLDILPFSITTNYDTIEKYNEIIFLSSVIKKEVDLCSSIEKEIKMVSKIKKEVISNQEIKLN